MDFNLSLKIMLLTPAWYGKPYWKYLKDLNFGVSDEKGLISINVANNAFTSAISFVSKSYASIKALFEFR